MVRKRKKLRNKNRTWDSPVHVWVMSTRLAMIVALIVFGVIVHGVLAHHCKALNREIGKLESEQRVLLENLARERVRWTQLKTPRDLEGALRRHGISMGYPSPQQVVRMTPSGSPERYWESTERPAYVSR